MTEIKPDIDVATDGTATANTPAGERILADDAATTREAAVKAIADGMDVPAEVLTGEDAHGVYASGAWRRPAGIGYDIFPEVTVTRGGVTFLAPPKLLEELTHEELLARAKAYQRREDDLVRSLNKERRARRKAEKRAKRLLKIIERGL